jgi:hypothetical protein
LINRLIPISILILLGVLSALLYRRNIINLSFDTGDAPLSYGLAKHKNPHQGPYFGNKRGDNDREVEFGYFNDSFGNMDDSENADDEDAFSNNFTNQPNSTSTTTFLADIDLVNNFYSLEITVSGAEEGDPVRGWIDFNGNGKFDAFEKASSEYHVADKKTSLAWRLSDTLQPALTYARIRTCKKIYSESIEDPSTDVTGGEVEDYVVRIIKPQQISAEQRKFIDFAIYCSKDSINSFTPAINGLRVGDVTASVFVKGTVPDLFGFNNMHEASLCGLRIGHDSLDVTYEKPTITSIVFAKPLKKVSCKIIDIDGGDRVRIMGFYKGAKVAFKIYNLSDNFYYKYNAVKGEIYSSPNTDSGNDSFIPSSLDMGIEVLFEGLVDNIQLFYSDDLINSSGSYTLAAISARNADYPELNIEETTAQEKEKKAIVGWALQNKQSVAEFIVEKSIDGKTFEAIGKVDPASQPGNYFSFSDTASQLTRSCYYRIKAIELDNYIHYSETVRLKRSLTESLSGFYFVNQVFSNNLDLVFTTNITGKATFRLLNYKGLVVRTMLFDSIQKGDTLRIHNLEYLPENSYFGEISTPTSKYVVEAFKIINN